MPARPASDAAPYREGRFPVRLPAAGERDQARPVLDPAFALPDEDALGRSPDLTLAGRGQEHRAVRPQNT
ncbi:hypothetical protein [Streptomyces sp. NPDC001135]